MDVIEKEQIEEKFLEFYNSYYIDGINELYLEYPEKRSINIDIGNLEKFDIDLATALINDPDAILPVANSALAKLNPHENSKDQAHPRFFGSSIDAPLIQNVGSEYIGRMITVDSLVVKRSEIIPKISFATYKCMFCDTVIKEQITKEEVPEVCPQCKRKALKQINKESEFINMQRIAVQDPLEKLKGSTPTWQLEVWLADDLVNTVLPGDRVEITGVLRIRPRRAFRGKEDKLLFTVFFEANAIIHKQKEFAELDITDEDERQIIELSKDPRIFEKIAESIAPSIYGHDDIKKALALQLFGGTPDKQLIDGGMIRNDIHILLIGDPGSAKTRLLQAVTSLVPKGIYVSGKSTSAAGLTASAERDEFSEGGWTLKAGALVLGSGGEVSIDEFDKIGEDDKSALHEALESQTISVAKAGIVARFSTKTSVLAAANPKYGRFETTAYPVDQFNIPAPLMSRFDLIFPIRDVMDEEQDKRIAKHILMQHEVAGNSNAGITVAFEELKKPPMDYEILRKYIAYAKRNVKPRLTPEASARIEEFYIQLRSRGAKQGTTPITARQIEGLIRLAEASAKSKLIDTVSDKDAELSIKLFDYMLSTLGVDSEGRRDIDVIMGIPKEKVAKIGKLLNVIKKIDAEENGARMVRILEEAEKEGIDRSTTTKYMAELERSGDIYSPKQGVYKLVKREE